MATSSATRLGERLADLVGSEHVAPARAMDVGGAHADLVVSPGTLEEAAAVLLAVAESGGAVTPWGGGTQQRVGPPPDRLDVLLRTTRLDEVIEWEPGDLTACLQAGLTLGALQSRLAEHGQQLPIDAPDAERATLGGLVATNTSGPRRWRYGSWRDLVIGMHMALVNGTAVKTGGKVVKNVQGYDLGKLFIGSLGTLGLIGQVNVKLVPLPAARRLIVARGPLAGVCRFVGAVAASTVRASAVDLLDGAAMQTCGVGDRDYGGLVLLEGQPAAVDAGAGAVSALAAEFGLTSDAVETEPFGQVWRCWLALDRTNDLQSNEALLTVHARPAELESVIRAISDATDGSATASRMCARAGNGVVRARLAATASPANSLVAVQAALLAHWPATTLVAGDPAVPRAAKPWGADPAELEHLRLLKQRFDPARVLQPGRFVGGI
ncbi:MAG: FAD-binding oxidoreductase [Dehalococcoidia bacterium]